MIPERYAPITYALFRIAFGFLFLCYGLQKLLGGLAKRPRTFSRCKARQASSKPFAVC